MIRIEHDDAGLATGVTYVDGDGLEQFQRARLVCVAGNSIETPRLLLNSASSMFPDGLANSSGQVGRNYMRHLTASVYAIFDQPVRFYRGETMAGHIEDEAPTTRRAASSAATTCSCSRSACRSWPPSSTPARGAASSPRSWRATSGWPAAGWLARTCRRRPTASRSTRDEVDQYGQPVPNVHFDDHPNDLAMREHAWAAGEALYQSVGAVQTIRTPPYPATHNLGTARMSERPEDGVVNAFGQAHDVPNLFVSDGSQFTTGAAANPTLTIVALAIRQAEYIAEQLRSQAIPTGPPGVGRPRPRRRRVPAPERSPHERALRAHLRPGP